VFDTSELNSLQQLLADERDRAQETRQVAKQQQRKVLRVDCELDIKRIDRILGWVDSALKDKRREW